YPAHVGAEFAVTPARPWRDSSRRSFCRSQELGSSPFSVFSAGEGAEPCLPRQVCRRPQAPVPAPETGLLRPRRFAGGAEAVRQAAAKRTPPRLGGVCQARFRRPVAGAAISWPLHASGRHFQSSDRGLRWRARYVPLQGLCARRQTPRDDADCRRVPPPLLLTRPAERLRSHPPLRVS